MTRSTAGLSGPSAAVATCACPLSVGTRAASLHRNKLNVSIIESDDAFFLQLLTCIEDKDIVDYSFLSITFSASEYDEKLAELGR